jgi:hypothetical protein
MNHVYLLGIAGTTGDSAIAESFDPSDVLGFEQRELQQIVDAAVQAIRSRGLRLKACVRFGEPAIEIVAMINTLCWAAESHAAPYDPE